MGKPVPQPPGMVEADARPAEVAAASFAAFVNAFACAKAPQKPQGTPVPESSQDRVELDYDEFGRIRLHK